MQSGLVEMRPARGSLIAFACAPNQTASDGNGRNGTYTKNLLKHIATPSLDLNSLFVRVANGVEDETKGEQNPWQLSAIRVENPCLT